MNPRPSQLEVYQRRSATIMLCMLVVALVGVGARLVYINQAHGDHLRSVAGRQHESRSIVPARRGMILDARGRVLAVSRQMPDVFVDPVLSDDWADLAARLAPRINVEPREILDRLWARVGSRFVVVAREVDEVTASAVAELGDRAIGLSLPLARRYPMGESMAQVVGFVGREQRGLEGIELRFNDHLAGHNGRRVTVRDARRRTMWRSGDYSSAPQDGGHVVLTIDSAIQEIVEEALAATVSQFDAENGVALVISPKTGDILAMANEPTFDPHHPGDSPGATRRNRIVTDATEPGSTFKPIITCGALDGGFVSTTEEIDCHNGVHYFGKRRVTDTKPRSNLDLRGILINSSNIGMATIGTRMGNGPLYETIRRFGLGETTGIRFPGEGVGLVRPLDQWTSYSATSVSFGYEIGVTPLQLATAFVAIINDGLLIRPRLVRQLLTSDGAVVQHYGGPEVVRRAASTEVARYVSRELLVSVVEHGSGAPAKQGGYSVMGKTGTAKLPYRDRGGYEPGQYSSAFVGAAPVREPEIVVLVMIRRPAAQRGYYGRQVAAPTAGRIIARTLAYLQVPPDQALTQASDTR